MGELKRVDRKLVYQAHRVKVYEDLMQDESGRQARYDYVENRNGAGILLIDEDGKLILVKQYRNTLDDYDVEIAAGCAESCEDLSTLSGVEFHDMKGRIPELREKDNFDPKEYLITALREAEEETGFIPETVTLVNYMIAAVGLFSERTAIFIGQNLREGHRHLDEEESIEIVHISLERALNMIYEGQIRDSKTIIAILAYQDLKRNADLL